MKNDQLPHALMMVRPATFGFNTETASSNLFQQNSPSDSTLSSIAREEFDNMVQVLEAHDIAVHVFDDSDNVVKPDAIFPNNWVTFHHDGGVILYPMMAPSRRLERNTQFIEKLRDDFTITKVVDLARWEEEGKYLEGTGSMVMDHVNRVVYACRSPRTNENILTSLCELLQYKKIVFDAVDERGVAIYHTNVMMSVADKFAIVCLDAIQNESDQDVILGQFEVTQHKVIAISFAQMNSFAGNMLTVRNKAGESFTLMSQRAFQSLLPGQLNEISKYTEILTFNIDHVERYGGGSVRCMVAGIHLPKK